MKLLRLEKELSFFKAKEEKLDKQDKSISEMRKNQMPLIRQQKSQENSAELIEKKRYQAVQ